MKNKCDVAERLEQRGIQKGIQMVIQQGVEQGIQQGVEQAIQQGIEQGKLERAVSAFKKMIQRNFSIEDAQAISELTDAQVADVMRSLEK